MYCEKITDASLGKFGEFCPNLQTIGLIECPQITEQGKVSLKHKIPKN